MMSLKSLFVPWLAAGNLFAAPVTTPLRESPRHFVDHSTELTPLPARQGSRSGRRPKIGTIVSSLALAIGVMTLLAVWRSRPAQRRLAYTQITDVTDSAVGPGYRPMVEWLRSSEVTIGFSPPIRFM